MKKVLLALLCGCIFTTTYAAPVDATDTTEATIKEKILADIQQGLVQKNHITDSTIAHLNTRLSNVDSLIKNTASNKDKMDKLVERVKLIEDKQKAVEENELNVYEANYQSTIINLASMDREIQPLILFHSTKDFFETLNETASPESYDGFKQWFDGFKKYVAKNKKHDATLEAIDNILTLSGNVSVGASLYGTITQLFCSGMATYVSTIKQRHKAEREQAQKMYTLTMTLGQFNSDKDHIEHEWNDITRSLGDMQVYYDTVLQRNLQLLGCNIDDFNYHFVNEKDADKRYLYLSSLRQKAADLVASYKGKVPKEWKDDVYYQLVDVQTLKTKYGDITYRISEHIGLYDGLIKKYKSDKMIGPKVVLLRTKLDDLKSTFDQDYEPKDYKDAIVRMYKVM